MENSLTVYGTSDDLIEIEGSLEEEFGIDPDPDQAILLAFSDGTLLSVLYDAQGIWRFAPLARGSAEFGKIEATDADTDYTDRVTLKSDRPFTWVVCGSQVARNARARG